MSELKLLSKIIQKTSSRSDLVLDNGDDAAVIKIGDSLIAITTDAVVEGHHFSLAYFSKKQVGIKAVESAVSDLVATGAVPKGIVIALGKPPAISDAEVEALYSGVYDACERLEIELLGGDIVATDVTLELTVTAIGHVPNEKAVLRRAKAKAGDLICLTGSIGNSQAGLRAIQMNLSGFEATCLKHLEPRCRVDLVGKLLGVNAGIDISDGLSSELNHICRNSQCGALIEAIKIPITSEVKEIAQLLGEDPLEYALNGGEDYELLLTVSKENYQPCFGTIIGTITAEPKVVIDIAGLQKELIPNGYDHLDSTK